MPLDRRALAIAALFAVAPAAAAGGALALPVLLSLAGLCCVSARALRQAVVAHPAWLVALFAWAAWTALTSAWNPAGAVIAAKLWALLLLGLFVIAAAGGSGRITRAAGVAAFLVLAALLSVEALAGQPLNRAANPETPPEAAILNPMRGALVLLALTWGAAGGLLAHRRRWLFALVILIGGALSAPFGLSAHVAAFAVGLVVFALALRAPRLALLASSGGLAAWVLAAPFATPLLTAAAARAGSLPFSWTHRLAIWSEVSRETWQAPWLGHGLGASRELGEIVIGAERFYPPMHPHSASLQIWYETGAVGAGLAALVLMLGGMALARALGDKPAAAGAAAASLLSLGLVANVSFSLWAEWWAASMLLAATLVAAAAAGSGAR